jgi:hypothetical protein
MKMLSLVPKPRIRLTAARQARMSLGTEYETVLLNQIKVNKV